MRRLGVLALIACSACARVPEHDPADWPIARVDVERALPTDDPAERIYRARCLPCHGNDGRGAGAVTGADFTSETGPLTRPDAELVTSIRDGRHGAIGVMPAHREILTEDEITQVLGYVRRTFGPTIAPVEAAPTEALDTGADAGPPAP